MSDPVTRTRRCGALLRKTVYGWTLLFAFVLFVVADAVRVLFKRRSN